MPGNVLAMPGSRTAFLIGGLMIAAGILAALIRPVPRSAGEPAPALQKIVPTQFGEWRDLPQTQLQVVNPQTQELLDRLYSDVLARTYVNASGYRIMLSLAYGSDQRGSLKAHKPEVCYPAQGFVVRSNDSGLLSTPFGDVPVRRLFTTLGARQEPLTYWFTVGDKAVQGYLQGRLQQLKFGLTGRIPDGMLFRVSSIDVDRARAFRMQEEFVRDLLQSLPPAERRRLSGLGDK